MHDTQRSDSSPELDERLALMRVCFTTPPTASAALSYDPASGTAYAPTQHEQRRHWEALCLLLDAWVERGIALGIELEAAERWLSGCSDLVRIAPSHWYCDVTYQEWVDSWTAWTVRVGSVTRLRAAPHPSWRLVRAIALHHELADAEIEQSFCSFLGMAQVPGLFLIREPDHRRLDQRFFQALAGSTAFASLRHLRISQHHVDDRALSWLARWPGLQLLRVLDISEGSMSAWGIGALLGSAFFGGLEQLRLTSCGLNDAAATALAAGSALAGLRMLDLRWNAIGEAGRQALAHAPHLGQAELLL